MEVLSYQLKMIAWAISYNGKELIGNVFSATRMYFMGK